MGWMIFAGILFLALGLFLAIKPSLFWKLTEQWKSYYADEPSDFYLISTRFGGVMFVLVGIAAIICPLFLE